MTCLATVMGEKLESPVVTDLRENSYSGEYLTPGNPAAGESSTDQGMAMIRLCISFPDDGTLAHVPLSGILDYCSVTASLRIPSPGHLQLARVLFYSPG
jgi:hypothetical protein